MAHHLAHFGIRITRITAGMPTEEEAAALRIGAGVPVLRFTRRHLAGDGSVSEVAHPIVRPGDTTKVDYAIDLDD